MRSLILLLLIPFFSCTTSSSQSNPLAATKADTVAKDSFVQLEFLMLDKPCLAVIDKKYKNFAAKAEFPLSFFITVNTVDKNKDGHPTAKEAMVFNSIEEEILKELTPLGICYVGRTTMTGYRDMLFYLKTSDQAVATQYIASLRKKYPRIQSFTFENDPQWEAVEEFYTAVK